jgi:hypothetical protein
MPKKKSSAKNNAPPAKTKKKSTAKAPARSKAKTIIASKTGFHGFDNDGISLLKDALVIAKAFEQSASRGFSHKLFETLGKSTPSFVTQDFTGSAFRALPPGRKASALDDKATFGAGGRVNIGMKQQDALFTGPMSHAQGGIYCSKDSKTAKIEFLSIAPGRHEIVELCHESGRFTLIDFDALVQSLDLLLSPESLAGRVNASPFDGAWKYQAFPLASQILGNWLRIHANKADGLSFQSTKDPNGLNFFIFSPRDWSVV